MDPTDRTLSSPAATALYVGALLGPALLLLPGLALDLAGPASVIAWAGLILLSALLARTFTALGLRLPRGGGIVGYVSTAFGPSVGRVVGDCFLAGVVVGAPAVALIGGAYVADLFDGGPVATAAAGTALMAAVVTVGLGGRGTPAGLQLGLVAVLVVLVLVAVVGSLPAARATSWTPFAPHGWAAVGRAASVLMLSFVGWEAVSPLIARLRDPRRQLPVVTTAAFAITAVLLLGLALSTVAVLGGDEGGTAVPLSALLHQVVGPVARPLTAVAAVALTLATTTAYLAGATELARRRMGGVPRGGVDRATRDLRRATVLVSAVVLAGVGGGVADMALVVGLPTVLFLVVYVACTTAAATRLLTGGARVAAAVSALAVTAVLPFAGWALLAVPLVVAGSVANARSAPTHRVGTGTGSSGSTRGDLRP